MHIRLLVAVVAMAVGFVPSQGLADERRLWDSTVGDLIGIPSTDTTPVAAAPGPSSVNIEFVVDQCDAGVGEPIDLAELQPEPVHELAPKPKAEPEPKAEPQPEPEPRPEPKTTDPNPMEIAVAPDAVLPSLESLATPVPLRQRGPVEISPSILYLP